MEKIRPWCGQSSHIGRRKNERMNSENTSLLDGFGIMRKCMVSHDPYDGGRFLCQGLVVAMQLL